MKSNNSDLAKDVASLADTLKILKQNANNKNTKSQYVDRVSDDQMIKDFNERIEYQRKEKNKINAKLESLNNAFSNIKIEKETLSNEFNGYKKKNDKILSSNNKLELEINIFRAEIKNLKHKMAQKDEIIHNQLTENEDLTLLINEEQVQKKNIQSKINKIEKKSNEYDNAKDNLVNDLNMKINNYKQLLKDSEKEKFKKNKEKEDLKAQVEELKQANFKIEHLVQSDLHEKSDLVQRLIVQNRELESLCTLQKNKLDKSECRYVIIRDSFKEFTKRLGKFKSELEQMHLIEDCYELTELDINSFDLDIND